MFPFVHLPQYGLIVCSECQHAVLPSHVDTHLGDKKRHDMPKESRDRIIQEIQGIPRLRTERDELNRLVFPSLTLESPGYSVTGFFPHTKKVRA